MKIYCVGLVERGDPEYLPEIGEFENIPLTSRDYIEYIQTGIKELDHDKK